MSGGAGHGGEVNAGVMSGGAVSGSKSERVSVRVSE